MSAHHPVLTRREFLNLSSLGLAGVVLPAGLLQQLPAAQGTFPAGERLGRVIGGRTPVKLRPDIDSPDVGLLNDDDVVVWLNETVGKRPLWYSQRFVETPDGYIYAPNLQPVYNLPNKPLKSLPSTAAPSATPSPTLEPAGFWAEVSVPYVDITLSNPPARSPWLKNGALPRLYYSQVMWVDQIKTGEQGQVLYHVVEKYGSFGDKFWAAAEAFRPIKPEDISPINPEAEEKRVQVNLLSQTMACFEGTREVYFCRISTGGKWDADGNPSEDWATPLGAHSIWRKLVSVHMTGGTTGGGYDLPGIGWTTLFSGNGVAIHSTFWHNSFGIPKSHGCVNAQPDDAKWVFRWTNPPVPYFSGDLTVSGSGSTKVEVVEA